jgi:VanZ family protein
MQKFFNKIYVPIIWVLIIHILLLIPGKNLREESLIHIPNLDKVIHFGFYFVLVGSWIFYFSQNEELSPQQKKIRGIIILVLAITDGIAIEFLQRQDFISRDFSWFDALFDSLGAISGLILSNYIIARRSKKRKPLWKQGP